MIHMLVAQLIWRTLCFCGSLSGAVLRPGGVIGVVNGGILLTSNAKLIKTSSCVFALEGIKRGSLLLCILQRLEPGGQQKC